MDIALDSRLGKCEVCATNEARYTCPKCEVKTCQLACLKVHKKELECDGIRDKTKYIPLKKMTKMDFQSDYNFLEECTRYVQDRKRDKIKGLSRFNRELPLALYKLRAACRVRGISLRYLLPHFSRRKTNSTRLDMKTQVISWKVEWNFLDGDKTLVFIDELCNENEKVSTLLWKYLDPLEGDRRLEYYQGKGLGGIKVLLRSEGVRKCKQRFFNLDPDLSLKQNLMGKTIVENPVILVVSSDLAPELDIIDSDEDLEADKSLYNQLIGPDGPSMATSSRPGNVEVKLEQSLNEQRERDRKRKAEEMSQKNFLFTDESFWDVLSDSDRE